MFGIENKLIGMFVWVMALCVFGAILNYFMHKRAKGEKMNGGSIPYKILIGIAAGLILIGITRLNVDFFLIIIPAIAAGFAGESFIGKALGISAARKAAKPKEDVKVEGDSEKDKKEEKTEDTKDAPKGDGKTVDTVLPKVEPTTPAK